MAPHSSTLAWKIPWAEEPGRLYEHGEALYSQQKQDRELTMARIMNSLLTNSEFKLKKVGKTALRYYLNQIPYDYTVEVTNRFK